jgi:succinate dehydrogenase / fumarate reductase flavoprotein subunit
MYTQHLPESIKKIEAARSVQPTRLSAEEKQVLLAEFHPDYQASSFEMLQVGPNAGEKAPVELTEMLHSNSRVRGISFDLEASPEHDCDVLIIGGGGAGASAAIEAHQAGAKVIIVTKLRMGDANSMMAEGGIQAADKANDSPAQHYLDAYGGGHYAAKPELLKRLVTDGPEAIHWLSNLGVLFDKESDGTMVTTHGGGTSRKRMHACADYTGAEITRVLRDEVHNLKIPIIEYTAAVELIMDESGQVGGALLLNLFTQKYEIARAKTVILATGGAGRMHYNGFPTSNHYGATADGLVLAYRVGAKLLYQDALQYHPTGVAYPAQLFGALVTEKVRALGAGLFNANGEAFVHPLETRDVVSAAIMRECREGRGVYMEGGIPAEASSRELCSLAGQPDAGASPDFVGCRSNAQRSNAEQDIPPSACNAPVGVWLDSPNIDLLHGGGHIEKHLPGMLRMFMNYGIDMRKTPILVYPTLHYQNGGIEIEPDGSTKKIPNLFVAGEAVGGIHGRNRLMGNSLLDIIVFGRLTGKNAAKKARDITPGTLSLQHVENYAEALAEKGIATGKVSPLLLPDYTSS